MATRSRLTIEIAKTDTALDPGRYTDALAVTEGTNTDVFWVGQILVAATRCSPDALQQTHRTRRRHHPGSAEQARELVRLLMQFLEPR
jgi:hypothetical protein